MPLCVELTEVMRLGFGKQIRVGAPGRPREGGERDETMKNNGKPDADGMVGGTEILHQFDILKEAGENRAIEKVFHGITPNAQGRIDLDFEPVVNYAKVQAIELMPDDRR